MGRLTLTMTSARVLPSPMTTDDIATPLIDEPRGLGSVHPEVPSESYAKYVRQMSVLIGKSIQAFFEKLELAC